MQVTGTSSHTGQGHQTRTVFIGGGQQGSQLSQQSFFFLRNHFFMRSLHLASQGPSVGAWGPAAGGTASSARAETTARAVKATASRTRRTCCQTMPSPLFRKLPIPPDVQHVEPGPDLKNGHHGYYAQFGNLSEEN